MPGHVTLGPASFRDLRDTEVTLRRLKRAKVWPKVWPNFEASALQSTGLARDGYLRLLRDACELIRCELCRFNKAMPAPDILWRGTQRLFVANITRYWGKIEGHFVAEQMDAEPSREDKVRRPALGEGKSAEPLNLEHDPVPPGIFRLSEKTNASLAIFSLS